MQHRIDRENPPIIDAMTSGTDGHNGYAHGTGLHDLVGRVVVTVYEVPDSDRGETLLLLLAQGAPEMVVLLSCDPGYAEDHATRTPEAWSCCAYDATDTAAGRVLMTLERGHWL